MLSAYQERRIQDVCNRISPVRIIEPVALELYGVRNVIVDLMATERRFVAYYEKAVGRVTEEVIWEAREIIGDMDLCY